MGFKDFAHRRAIKVSDRGWSGVGSGDFAHRRALGVSYRGSSRVGCKGFVHRRGIAVYSRSELQGYGGGSNLHQGQP